MSDSRQDKPASIPSWQTKEQSRENEDNAQGSDHSGQGAPVDSPRAALLAKATKFLDEDEIREASTESKISFLEGKGLTNDEIQELFRISRHGNHLQAAPIKIEGAKSEVRYRLETSLSVANCFRIVRRQRLESEGGGFEADCSRAS